MTAIPDGYSHSDKNEDMSHTHWNAKLGRFEEMDWKTINKNKFARTPVATVVVLPGCHYTHDEHFSADGPLVILLPRGHTSNEMGEVLSKLHAFKAANDAPRWWEVQSIKLAQAAWNFWGWFSPITMFIKHVAFGAVNKFFDDVQKKRKDALKNLKKLSNNEKNIMLEFMEKFGLLEHNLKEFLDLADESYRKHIDSYGDFNMSKEAVKVLDDLIAEMHKERFYNDSLHLEVSGAFRDSSEHFDTGKFCSTRRTHSRTCQCDHRPVAVACQNPKDSFQTVMECDNTHSGIAATCRYSEKVGLIMKEETRKTYRVSKKVEETLHTSLQNSFGGGGDSGGGNMIGAITSAFKTCVGELGNLMGSRLLGDENASEGDCAAAAGDAVMLTTKKLLKSFLDQGFAMLGKLGKGVMKKGFGNMFGGGGKKKGGGRIKTGSIKVKGRRRRRRSASAGVPAGGNGTRGVPSANKRVLARQLKRILNKLEKEKEKEEDGKGKEEEEEDMVVHANESLTDRKRDLRRRRHRLGVDEVEDRFLMALASAAVSVLGGALVNTVVGAFTGDSTEAAQTMVDNSFHEEKKSTETGYEWSQVSSVTKEKTRTYEGETVVPPGCHLILQQVRSCPPPPTHTQQVRCCTTPCLHVSPPSSFRWLAPARASSTSAPRSSASSCWTRTARRCPSRSPPPLPPPPPPPPQGGQASTSEKSRTASKHQKADSPFQL